MTKKQNKKFYNILSRDDTGRMKVSSTEIGHIAQNRFENENLVHVSSRVDV